MRVSRVVAGGMLIVALVLSGGGLAQASPLAAGATVTVKPTSGVPGAVVKVTGTGFCASATASVNFKDSANTTTHIGQVTADSTGAFSANETIPTTAATGAGKLIVKSSQCATQPKAHAKFTVT